MSQWQAYSDTNTYYFLVDSKPAETVDLTKPDRIFCTAFVDTSSSIQGVINSDLPWFKEAKNCETLEESLEVLKKLKYEIINNNFFDLKVTIIASTFATIDKNTTVFLPDIEKEVAKFSIQEDKVKYKSDRYNINKAKMLVWYNLCLSFITPLLIKRTIKAKKRRGIFAIDRLGDSDKKIQKFMRMLMNETSLRELWKKSILEYKDEVDYIGYAFLAHVNDEGKKVPAINSMQNSLVDWIVLAAYAYKNGLENRDPSFQHELIHLIEILQSKNSIKFFHFSGDITWD